MGLKKMFHHIAKRSHLMRLMMRKWIYIYRRFRYMVRSFGIKTDTKTIVFETFSGRNYSDSPKAIYEYMLNDKSYDDYSFVWVFKDIDKYTYLTKNKNTRLVKYDSKEYEKALAEAKYWIFNYRALDHLIPRKDQIYVQCWHGTPLKRLGYDITKSDNAMNSIEEIRDKYYRDAVRFDFLISPCEFSSDKFKSAWNLKTLNKEECILEVGYPRNDYLINSTQEDIVRVKEKIGIKNIDKKVLLYAPTWRDDQHQDGLGYTYKDNIDFGYLREYLSDEYIILFRSHYLIANEIELSEYEDFVYDVSDVDDINELYVISDLLITDYSSVFFDYAILSKPILFYMYDLDKYRDDLRGFYLTLDELPGKIIEDKETLVNEITAASMDEDRMKKFNKKFNYLNDGKAAVRFVSEVFGK